MQNNKSEVLVKIEEILTKYYSVDSVLFRCAEEIWQTTTSRKTLQSVTQALLEETNKNLSLEKEIKKFKVKNEK